MLASRERKRLRQLAHHLEPLVVVGDRGITEAVVAETRRALGDHELIKARLNVADRTLRREWSDDLAARCAADIVQTIGKVVVLYRENPEADPRLSNVARLT